MSRLSGTLLRSLFGAFVVSSLVACSIEAGSPDDSELTTSKLDQNGGEDEGEGATLAPDDVDASPDDVDADVDGGPYDHDGGPYDHDGGPYDHDGGWGGDGGHHDGGHYDGGKRADAGDGF